MNVSTLHAIKDTLYNEKSQIKISKKYKLCANLSIFNAILSFFSEFVNKKIVNAVD